MIKKLSIDLDQSTTRPRTGNNFPQMDFQHTPLVNDGGRLTKAEDNGPLSLFSLEREGLKGLRAIVESIADAVVVTDGDGTIALANRSARRMFGYPSLDGQPVEVLIPGHLHDAHRVYRRIYLHNPEQRPIARHSHLWARRASGEAFCVRIGLVPFWTDQGVWTAAVITETETPKAES